jgi:hypothetical protein
MTDFNHACRVMALAPEMRALLVRILAGVEREGFTDAPLWDEVRTILKQTERS